MELLLTGWVAALSAPFCRRLTEEHKLVVAAKQIPSVDLGRGVDPFSYGLHEDRFEKLFHSYSFDTVMYFARRPEEDGACADDLRELEQVLRLCAAHDVRRVVFFSSTSVFAGLDGVNEETRPAPITSAGVALTSCEELCAFYRMRHAIEILILRTPVTFGYGESASMVGGLIAQAVRHAAVRFKGGANQLCDFLSQEDLAELLMRMLDSWPEEHPVIHVPGAKAVTFGELGAAFIERFPTLRVSYAEHLAPIAEPVASDIPRRDYDWIPTRAVTDELERLIAAFQAATQLPKRSAGERIKGYLSAHPIIIRTVELLLGYGLMELLLAVTKTSVQFQYVDFRLLFVMLLATLHGLRTGLAASALACLSCFLSYMANGMDWRIIAYNVDNWIPFACFVIMGAVAGYTRDRMRNDLRFVQEEKADLEQRYVFLNELYIRTLENKSQYKNQIMSYRDSFGRIFEVTRRLNTVMPDEVFKEALIAMEDILDNQSICLYTFDQNARFGRLMVCSKAIADTTGKSVDLEKYGLMVPSFEEGEVWCNNERLLGYPEYAAPIFQNGRLVALITIQKTRFDQMAMYYQNLIKVLCGLIQAALLRAIEFMAYTETEQFIEGTRIMKKEAFRKVLAVREEMEEKAVAEESLRRMAVPPEQLDEVGARISKALRSIDVVGQGADGDLYVILTQTGQENIGVVLERLKRCGIGYQALDGSERGGATV